MAKSGSSYSISIGGQVRDSVVVAGSRNVVTQHGRSIALPPADTVDIRAELAALRAALEPLQPPDAGKIERAFADADEELEKPEPDKGEIGRAIERILGYAGKAAAFSTAAATLAPHIAAIAAWLGTGWERLLDMVA